MADRAAAPSLHCAQSRSRIVHYCRPVAVWRAPLSLAHTGEGICTWRQTAPDEAKPVRPPSSQREACRRVRRGNDDSRGHARRRCRHAEMGLAVEIRGRRCSQSQLRPEGCTAPRNCKHGTQHTIDTVRGLYKTVHTHTRMHGSPKTRDKKTTGLQLALPPPTLLYHSLQPLVY